MTQEQTIWLIGGIIIGVIIIATAILTVLDYRKNKHKYVTREQARALEDARLEDDGEIFEAHAEVINMACGVETVGYQGYKQPRAVKQFIITFRADGGSVLHVSVPEEFYEGFDVGMSGTLTLVDGEIKNFLPDEDRIS